MAEGIEAVRQKILWADHHFKFLEIEIPRYFSQKPGELVTDDKSDPKVVFFNFHLTTPVPDNIGFIVGDVLQNLRSCLDYLIWELVTAGQKQTTGKEMFPICDGSDTFKKARKRLTGLPVDAITEIERLQPYYGGDCKEVHILWLLNHLCNISKHRRLLLTVLTPAQITADWPTDTGVQKITAPLPSNFEADFTLGRPTSLLGKHVEVEGEITFLITFNEGAAKGIDVVTYLMQMFRFISGRVLPTFQRFFPT
jgi:hypothetical protein